MDAGKIDIGTKEITERTHPEIWLLGQPPLESYLEFVRDSVVGGANIHPAALVNEWREANDYYCQLEEEEAGIAELRREIERDAVDQLVSQFPELGE